MTKPTFKEMKATAENIEGMAEDLLKSIMQKGVVASDTPTEAILFAATVGTTAPSYALATVCAIVDQSAEGAVDPAEIKSVLDATGILIATQLREMADKADNLYEGYAATIKEREATNA